MTRLEAALRWLAGRLMDQRRVERVFDAALADLRFEVDGAVATGTRMRPLAVAFRGYLSLLALLARHLCDAAVRSLTVNDEDERRALKRMALVTAATLVALTAALTLPSASVMFSLGGLALAAYVIPQAFPISIPVALIVGILSARRSEALRSNAQILIGATALSLASFVLLGWGIPLANQAFRETAANQVGANQSVAKAVSEMTLPELRRATTLVTSSGSSSSRQSSRMRWNYHVRWALPWAPLMLAIFALASLRSCQAAVWRLLLAAGVVVVYGTLLVGGSTILDGWSLPPPLVAWLPNLFVAAGTVAMMRALSRQQGVPER